MLQDKTRILVTHAVDFMHLADRLIIMTNGEVSASGTYEELSENPHLLYLRLWGLEQVGDQETFREEKEWYDMVCDPECTQRVQRNLSLELQAPLPFTF